MLFFFSIINKSNRWFIKVVNHIARSINHIQIFEKTFFNDFLHDFNSFTFSLIKRVFKRFLNDITIDVNNKLSKTFKHVEKRSSNKKNQFHSIKNSRVDFHVIFYVFLSSLFSQVARSLRNKRRSRLQFFFFFTFFSSFFSLFSTFFIFFFDQFFSFSIQNEKKNEENDYMQNALRHMIDKKHVRINEHASKSDALIEFHDIDDYVSKSKKKIEKIEEIEKKFEKLEKKTHQSFISTIRRVDRSKVKKRQDKNLKYQWMHARKLEIFFVKHFFNKFDVKKNECFYCDIFQYFEKCDFINSTKKYWHYCFNDRVHQNMIQVAENDLENLKRLKNDEIKNAMRVLKNEIQKFIHKLMHDVEIFVINSNVKTRIKTSKNFQKLIIFYNNVFFLQRVDDDELQK